LFSVLSRFCCCFYFLFRKSKTNRRADGQLQYSRAVLYCITYTVKAKKERNFFPGVLFSPGYVIFYPVLYTALLPHYATLPVHTPLLRRSITTILYCSSGIHVFHTYYSCQRRQRPPTHVHNDDKINNGQTPPRNRPPHRQLPYKAHRRGLTPPRL